MQALFSVPFLQLQVKKEDLTQCQMEASLALGKYGSESPPGWVSNSYGTFNDKDHNIIFTPEMSYTKDVVASCLSYFCQEAKLEHEQLIIGDSWLNRYDKGMSQEVHNHMRYTFSFIMYISVPEDTPPLLMYNPYRAMMASPSPFDMPIMSIPVEEGKFIIFPSYVDHSVPTQMTTKSKISLAGNIFYDPTPRQRIITK